MKFQKWLSNFLIFNFILLHSSDLASNLVEHSMKNSTLLFMPLNVGGYTSASNTLRWLLQVRHVCTHRCNVAILHEIVHTVVTVIVITITEAFIITTIIVLSSYFIPIFFNFQCREEKVLCTESHENIQISVDFFWEY